MSKSSLSLTGPIIGGKRFTLEEETPLQKPYLSMRRQIPKSGRTASFLENIRAHYKEGANDLEKQFPKVSPKVIYQIVEDLEGNTVLAADMLKQQQDESERIIAKQPQTDYLQQQTEIVGKQLVSNLSSVRTKEEAEQMITKALNIFIQKEEDKIGSQQDQLIKENQLLKKCFQKGEHKYQSLRQQIEQHNNHNQRMTTYYQEELYKQRELHRLLQDKFSQVSMYTSGPQFNHDVY